MILYASSPDGLAQQQLSYDQMYGNTQAANVGRLDASNAQALQLALQQQSAQRQAASDARNMAFTAQQNDLNRQVQLEDTQTRANATRENRQDSLDTRNFSLAQQLASTGSLPDGADDIAAQYPQLDQSQVNALATANADAKFTTFQKRFQQSLQQGAPILPNQVGTFLSPKSPRFKDAVDFASGALAPAANVAASDSRNAQAGNYAQKIVTDTTAPPLDTSMTGASWWNPVSWPGAIAQKFVPNVPAQDVVQPRGDWQAQAGKIVSALRANPAASGVVPDAVTGGFAPAQLNPFSIQPSSPVIPAASAPASPVQQVPPVGQRRAGQVYQLPTGAFMWTGTGWVRAQ